MAGNSSDPGVLRYLKGRSPAQPVPMNYNIVSFARSVMVSDVQKLFVSPSFPPELRLQVMKAGVPSNTTCKLSIRRSMKTIEGLRDEARGLLLFPPREHWYQLDPWADEGTSKIMRNTAEQAFLETAIFKLGINDSLPILEDNDWMSGLSSIPETIGSRIHYLDLSTTVSGHLGIYSDKVFLHVGWCQRTVAYMDMLKLHFPNLKTCVLTLDLCFDTMFGPQLHPFDQTALQWTKGTDTDSYRFLMGRDAKPDWFETSLPAEASSLFDAFVAKGPGKSQFVRIRHFPHASSHVKDRDGTVYCGPLVKVNCEKMAAEPEKGSFGTQLFEEAYRLARSEERSEISARVQALLGWR